MSPTTVFLDVVQPRTSQGEPDPGPNLRGTTTTLLVLAFVFVVLRFLARWKRGLKYGADDWMIVVSLMVCFAAGGLNYGMIHWGLGKHAVNLPPGNITMVLKLLVAFECVYCTGVGMVKLSLLLMYMRIFPTKDFRIGAYILGFLTIGWVIAINFVSIFQCHPIKKAWLGPAIEGTCINLKASFIGNAIPNILTDIAILCMPVTQVLKLQVSVAHRASLIFMFALGTFVLFASIYRFTTIMQFDMADTTGTLATACTWCVVEVACGIMSACLPTLRPLMLMVSSKFSSTQNRSRKASNSGGQSDKTELVTIGGSGQKRTQDFKRLKDGYDAYNDVVVTQVHGGNDDAESLSSDKQPLAVAGAKISKGSEV
ncbi:integral membrane [Pyrenophora seminiperda CCB06]|uniref:Integral membrane n=1 Tax=Pyrenophora seminiperda CCB06 TaxID=1302712 RepID=A0A3M7LZT3_9PLEO|nr:integral membrane [Pyrenophora seminiperda CCB06]